DVDPERLRDDARNSWTAEPRIARLEFHDGSGERLVRPFRARLPRGRRRREQPAVFATHQGLMNRQERRGAEGDGDFAHPAWIEKERSEPAKQPVAPR